MKTPKLDEKVLSHLFQFAQTYVSIDSEEGRKIADKTAYEFVDTVYLEDIHLRTIYHNFYEDEKIRAQGFKEKNKPEFRPQVE